MRASEILRKFADMLDQQEGGAEQHEMQPHAELTQVEVDHTDGTDSTTMVPPLQQKLELLKKAVDVPNAFDGADELSDIKKLSGVNPAVIHIAADDDPIGV